MQTSQLEQLLKFLTDTLAQGKDFTLEQAPQFVRELLVWKFYESLIWCGVGVFVFVMAIAFGRFLAGCFDDDDDKERRAAQWLPTLVGAAIAAFIIGDSVSTMVQIKVAPRVVLVEMVRSLIAGPGR